MRRFRFGAGVGVPVSRFGSLGAVISRVDRFTGGAQIGVLHLEPGGLLGRHPASVRQLLLVVAGEGWVAGADGAAEPIRAGEAVCWEAGEDHATRTDTGLSAVVVESEGLDPERFMARRDA